MCIRASLPVATPGPHSGPLKLRKGPSQGGGSGSLLTGPVAPLWKQKREFTPRTMYPNSMDEILACTMDQSPQKKWDARANLKTQNGEHVSLSPSPTAEGNRPRGSQETEWETAEKG